MSEGIGRTTITITNSFVPIWTAEYAFAAMAKAERAALAAIGDDDLVSVRIAELRETAELVRDALGQLGSFLDSRALRAESAIWN